MKLVDGPMSAKLLHKMEEVKKTISNSTTQRLFDCDQELFLPVDCYTLQCESNELNESAAFSSLEKIVSEKSGSEYQHGGILKNKSHNLMDVAIQSESKKNQKNDETSFSENIHFYNLSTKEENQSNAMHRIDQKELGKNMINVLAICTRQKNDNNSTFIQDSTIQQSNIIAIYEIICPELICKRICCNHECFQLISDTKSVNWKKINSSKFTTDDLNLNDKDVITYVAELDISFHYNYVRSRCKNSDLIYESTTRYIKPILLTFDAPEKKVSLIESLRNTTHFTAYQNPENSEADVVQQPCEPKVNFQENPTHGLEFSKLTNQRKGILLTAKNTSSSIPGCKAFKIINSSLDIELSQSETKRLTHSEDQLSKHEAISSNQSSIDESYTLKNLSGIFLTAKRVVDKKKVAYEIKGCVQRKKDETKTYLNQYDQEYSIILLADKIISTFPLYGDNQRGSRVEQSSANDSCETAMESNVTDFYFVKPSERNVITDYMFLLTSQLKLGILTEKDLTKANRRKNIELAVGYRGMRCRHCGGFDRGNYFPSTCKNLQACPPMIHTHLMKCQACPKEIKISLEKTKSKHRKQVMGMTQGTQVSFFSRLWNRIHDTKYNGGCHNAVEIVAGMVESIVEENMNKKSSEKYLETNIKPNTKSRSTICWDDESNTLLTYSEESDANESSYRNDIISGTKCDTEITSPFKMQSTNNFYNPDQKKYIDDSDTSMDSDFDLVLEVLEEVSQDDFQSSNETRIDPNIDLTPNVVSMTQNSVRNNKIGSTKNSSIERIGSITDKTLDTYKNLQQDYHSEDTSIFDNCAHVQSRDNIRYNKAIAEEVDLMKSDRIHHELSHPLPCQSPIDTGTISNMNGLSYSPQIINVKRNTKRVVKMRKSCSKIFNNNDDVLLIKGMLKYGKRWKQIWDEFPGLQHIKQSSLKDRARSRRFHNLLERVRLDATILDDPSALYDFSINDITEDDEDADQSMTSPVMTEKLSCSQPNTPSSTILDDLITEFEFSSPPYHPIGTLQMAPESLNKLIFEKENQYST